jgi:hypothetical protein
MKKLLISDELSLPIEAATQTFLVVGKRGSGKTNTAARIVEQLLAAKVPVVVLDPVDAWWGLKASRDGKGAGHSVYVFGGRHADLPLEAGAGALIADFLCEHQASMVLSCKHLSGLERSRFMVDFTMAVYRKWTKGVLHLVLEEAHELAPQAPPKGEKAEEMLGAFKRLWKLGRSTGIGGTAVTQRPASLHKDITTQSEILVVHRTIGPQDVAAVRQWIKYHDQGEEILPELATLKTGEAFVWAPEFPEEKPIGLVRTRVQLRETYDSASTPKHGEQRGEPNDLAPVDLERLRVKMAATIERAKSEDPKELRKRIVELEKSLRLAKEAVPIPEVEHKVVEVPVLKPADLKRLEVLVARVEKAQAADAVLSEKANVTADRLATAFNAVSVELTNLRHQLARGATSPQPVPQAVPTGAHAPSGAGGRSAFTRTAPPSAPPPSSGNGSDLAPARQKILNALAFLAGIGVDRGDKTQVALLAGVSPTSGGYFNNLGALRSAGLIHYPGPSMLGLTEAGAALASHDGVPTTAEELHRALAGRLAPAKWKILNELIGSYPEAVPKHELAERIGVSATSGGYFNNLGSLRSLGLLQYPAPGQVVATPVLFLGERA